MPNVKTNTIVVDNQAYLLAFEISLSTINFEKSEDIIVVNPLPNPSIVILKISRDDQAVYILRMKNFDIINLEVFSISELKKP